MRIQFFVFVVVVVVFMFVLLSVFVFVFIYIVLVDKVGVVVVEGIYQNLIKCGFVSWFIDLRIILIIENVGVCVLFIVIQVGIGVIWFGVVVCLLLWVFGGVFVY